MEVINTGLSACVLSSDSNHFLLIACSVGVILFAVDMHMQAVHTISCQLHIPVGCQYVCVSVCTHTSFHTLLTYLHTSTLDQTRSI